MGGIYIGVNGTAQRTLPSGYTQIQYIQSSGSQYINTGFKPKYNTRVVMDAQITGIGTTGSFLFGARDEASATAANQFVLYTTNAGAFRSDYFGTNKSVTIADFTDRTVFDKNGATMTMFGTKIQNTAVTSGACSYPLFLFANNSAGTAHTFKAKLKLYSCQIYDNGTLVRDFVPCKNASGKAGLYDLVGGVFYTDAAGGSFTAGAAGATSGDLTRDVTDIYIGDKNGICRQVIKGFFGDENGIAQRWYLRRPPKSGIALGTLSVGSYVYLMGDEGFDEEFLVVHQGLPSADYDASCNGTWLLRSKGFLTRRMDGWNNDYKNSDMHAFLSQSLIAYYLDADFFKWVRIPYRAGTSGSTVSKGANGLLTRMFLLSRAEVGFSDHTDAPTEGAVLDYFKGATDETRIAIGYQTGISSNVNWWLRTPSTANDSYTWSVDTSGSDFKPLISRSDLFVRPAFILPSDALVDEDHRLIV